jgi:hypothetical protein
LAQIVEASPDAKQPLKHRFAVAASWVAACIPAALLIAIAISAAYIRLSFGRWPAVYRDSVHARFSEAASNVAAICVFALLPTILLLPVVAVGRALAGIRPVLGRWAVWLTIGWIAVFLLIRWDPTGFLDWVVD